MSKHSPGPWRYNDSGELLDADGNEVLFKGLSNLLTGGREIKANAIANTGLAILAPEMLSMLETCASYIAKQTHYNNAVDGMADEVLNFIDKAKRGLQ
jgi:hypothetical protein